MNSTLILSIALQSLFKQPLLSIYHQIENWPLRQHTHEKEMFISVPPPKRLSTGPKFSFPNSNILSSKV